MEPVVLSKAIAPVRQSDRVKRAKPREDSGRGFRFARHLRAQPQQPSGPPDNADGGSERNEEFDTREVSEGGASAARRSAMDADAFKKLIDIHV